MEVRIVEGKYAEISEVPHLAFLYVGCKRPGYLTSFCGSSILNQHLLVTAAHCFIVCPQTYLNVLAHVGSKNISSSNKYSVTDVVKHEDFQETTLANDIALVLLTAPLKLGKGVQRVAIMKNPPKRQCGEVSGWGRTDAKGSTVSQLVKVGIQSIIYSDDDCMKEYRIHWKPNGTLCAKSIPGCREYGYASHGDSGGGLIVDDFILIGIVSSTRLPHTNVVMYTDIAYFYSWIQNKSEDLYCFYHPPENETVN